MRRQVPLTEAYRLIGSGPVVLVSSLYKKRAGITPIAWHMPVSDDPPIIALEIWRDHFIYKAVIETGDFVVNIPSSDMAETVCRLGSVSGTRVDKFKEYGLVKEAAAKIRSPRLRSAIGILECKLRREPAMQKKYSLIFADIVYAEAEKSLYNGRWLVEKKGKRVMHHLGGKVFSVPAEKIA
jgi:flavin reductase (DIM6/NTAB) family NADH-FMN oxidoreductase RutF